MDELIKNIYQAYNEADSLTNRCIQIQAEKQSNEDQLARLNDGIVQLTSRNEELDKVAVTTAEDAKKYRSLFDTELKTILSKYYEIKNRLDKIVEDGITPDEAKEANSLAIDELKLYDAISKITKDLGIKFDPFEDIADDTRPTRVIMVTPVQPTEA